MYIKNALIIIFILISNFSISQKIDDVGDGWKQKVDSALRIIKKYDKEKYNIVKNNCTNISYWLGDFSTTNPPGTILITVDEMKSASVNNIAAIIVHESTHLKIHNEGEIMSRNKEEAVCYEIELDFLRKVPGVENWLVLHAIQNMIRYKNLYLNE
jgi:hypothetical protein